MIQIKGHWYPKNSSARKQAELLIRSTRNAPCQLICGNAPAVTVGLLSELAFSDRIGNIPRKITLTDGSVFETKENDHVDKALQQNAHHAVNIGILHKLESHWGWISTALVVTVVVTYSFFKWGLPWGANKLTYAIPISVTQRIGGDVLDFMDGFIFKESKLADSRQDSLRERYSALAHNLNETAGFNFTFHFRNMVGIPNAMALPSGDIIVTDKLIEIAEDPQEIDAVLLHEIGHVVHRHGLQQVFQSAFVSVLVAMVTGDVSGSSEILVAFPAFLLQSQYMRHHESDADEYAFKQMMAQGIDPKHFASIMQRMTDEVKSTKSESDNSKAPPIGSPDAQEEQVAPSKDISAYFATHPITRDRIERAMMYSLRFAQKYPE